MIVAIIAFIASWMLETIWGYSQTSSVSSNDKDVAKRASGKNSVESVDAKSKYKPTWGMKGHIQTTRNKDNVQLKTGVNESTMTLHSVNKRDYVKNHNYNHSLDASTSRPVSHNRGGVATSSLVNAKAAASQRMNKTKTGHVASAPAATTSKQFRESMANAAKGNYLGGKVDATGLNRRSRGAEVAGSSATHSRGLSARSERGVSTSTPKTSYSNKKTANRNAYAENAAMQQIQQGHGTGNRPLTASAPRSIGQTHDTAKYASNRGISTRGLTSRGNALTISPAKAPSLGRSAKFNFSEPKFGGGGKQSNLSFARTEAASATKAASISSTPSVSHASGKHKGGRSR